MRYLGVATLVSAVLVSMTNGDPIRSCNDVLTAGGNDFVQDRSIPNMFYHCSNNIPVAKWCSNLTVWDSAVKTCNFLAQAQNELCNASMTNMRYRGLCVNEFLTCNGQTFSMSRCQAGSYFSNSTGACVDGSMVEYESCGVNNAVNWVCYNAPDSAGDGRNCTYQTEIAGGSKIFGRPCPFGLSYNASSCFCDIPSDACKGTPVGVVTLNENKLPDSQCRESLITNFTSFEIDTGEPILYSKKRYMNLGYRVTSVGTQYFAAGYAQIRTDPRTGESGYIYLYWMNGNMLTPPTGFSVTVRLDNPTTRPVSVLVNNFRGACMPTLEVNVTFTGSVWTVNAYVKGRTMMSPLNMIDIDDTITANINAQAGTYVKISLLLDQYPRMQLTNMGPDGRTMGENVYVTGTRVLGPFLAFNTCGLSCGLGLDGTIMSISVSEGCLNSTAFFGRVV